MYYLRIIIAVFFFLTPAYAAEGDSLLQSLGSILDSDDETDDSQQEGKSEDDSEEEGKQNPTKKKWVGSLMYTPEDIDSIDEALKSLESGVPLEILMPKLFPSQQQTESTEDIVIESDDSTLTDSTDVIEETDTEEIVEEAAEENFYLSSILYFNPKSWTVWVNGKKVNKDNIKRSTIPFKITDVSERYITAIWNDAPLFNLSDDWRQYFYPIEGTNYVTNKQNIVVDYAQNRISFTLGINQNFSLAKMQIIEGRSLVMEEAQQKKEEQERIEAENSASQLQDSLLNSEDNILRGHNPSEGIEALYKFKGQVDMLKDVLNNNLQVLEGQ
jgi:hypothetical protein